MASENDPKDEGTKKPGSLPEDIILDVAVKDLLLRLLEVDPSKRLRSLRTLQTIAFYKGFDFEKVKEKKVCWKIGERKFSLCKSLTFILITYEFEKIRNILNKKFLHR